MGHGHAHGADGYRSSARTRLALALILAPLVVATAIALAVLWPFERTATITNPNALGTFDDFSAVITRVEERMCGDGRCTEIEARLENGPEAGEVASLGSFNPTSGLPPLRVGQEVVVTRTELAADPGVVNYTYGGPQRSSPLILLTACFVILVIGVARWRGLAALVGLAFTYWVLVAFVIPAILNGENPVAVALAGSSLVMLVVLYLAHGFNARTTTALLGTLASLGLLGVLSWLFVSLTELAGTGTEEVMFIQAAGGNLNLRGLLLAGIIIGSMGVLNDVTVTQASAVWELHRTDPTQPARSLYHAGMRVGRDHIASVVDTLVLAYAGASLPLLILFVINNRDFGETATTEIVAAEIVRTLVGSMGLIASVPITTLAAAVIVSRQQAPNAAAEPAEPRDAQEHGAQADNPAATSVEIAHRFVRSATGTVQTRAGRYAERRQAASSARASEKADRWQPNRRERGFWDDTEPPATDAAPHQGPPLHSESADRSDW